MNDTLSSLNGVFGAVALFGGMFFRRPKRAAIFGVVVGAILAAILVAAATSAGVQLDSYLLGRFVGGPILGCALVALLGYGIKRIFVRAKPAPSATNPASHPFDAN